MNRKFVIRGGKPLRGSVVGGGKNAAVAILPATILAEGTCVIENLPKIDDVIILLNIMKRLGAKDRFQRRWFCCHRYERHQYERCPHQSSAHARLLLPCGGRCWGAF